AEPYSLLGFAQGFNGDWENGLANMQKAVALSPRNTWYQFNLAQMYLNHRQPDQAIPLLQALAQSQDQQVAQRASESLAHAQQLKDMLARGAQFQEREPVRVRVETTEADEPDNPPPAAPTPGGATPSAGPVKFIKGTLNGVDCSTSPSAV